MHACILDSLWPSVVDGHELSNVPVALVLLGLEALCVPLEHMRPLEHLLCVPMEHLLHRPPLEELHVLEPLWVPLEHLLHRPL